MSINDQQETDPLFEECMKRTFQCFPDVLPFLVGDMEGSDQSLTFIEHNSQMLNSCFGGSKYSNVLQDIDGKTEGGEVHKENSFQRVGDMEGSDQSLTFIEHNSQMLNNCFGGSKYSNVLQDIDGKTEGGEVHKENSFQRVKWTDDMVKLLITVLSYIAEYDASVYHFKFKNGRFFVPKLGKWKLMSSVMFQRGYHVSPHQCEDKFNDLIKKYRRLNELLGRGRACEVVENPKLIGSMNLSREVVVEVMKILSCKQLFYREMCSYNNRNRFFIPHDLSVWNLVKLALKGNGNCSQEVIHEISAKRMKEVEDLGFAGSTSYLDCTGRSEYLLSECEELPNEWRKPRSLLLEEQKLQIREQRLELEKLLIESQQVDLELEKMRLENKVMKLENQRLAYEIRVQMSRRKVLCGKRGQRDE